MVAKLLAAGVPAGNITLSSDGNGSMPSFNEKGEMTGLKVGPLDSVIDSVAEMLKDGAIPPETVISLVTSNPADQMKLTRKGRVRPGFDGDVLVLDGAFMPRTPGQSRVMMEEGEVLVKGRLKFDTGIEMLK